MADHFMKQMQRPLFPCGGPRNKVTVVYTIHIFRNGGGTLGKIPFIATHVTQLCALTKADF